MDGTAIPVTDTPACGAGKWRADALAIELRTSPGLTDYAGAVAAMEARVEAIRTGREGDLLWLVEHPPVYTAGTSAKAQDLLAPGRFPVIKTGRGGQYTYHGPGQRVGYIMMDLKARAAGAPDIRCFVHDLEDWLIRTLAFFGVRGERRAGRVGIWVARPGGREDKIAALGIRVRHWISFHGVALNINPDLSHFTGIVPCGVSQHGVTSLADLGVTATMADVDRALAAEFSAVFGANLVNDSV
ncbi:MAG: lipoyl(octanoyl) transferase LipB [Rhodospirillaceae bacterium]|nr:lipoyl(octanoyl) transferase LipB [Rhodospirillaceae bacterium]